MEKRPHLTANGSWAEMPGIERSAGYRLPEILTKLENRGATMEERDLLLIGGLVALSGCMPNLYGFYDQRRLWPNLYAFITAPPASGKGVLNLCRDAVAAVDEWIAAQTELANDGEEHVSRGLFIPANSSASAFCQTLNDYGGRGLIHETEGDTLSHTFKQDVGNYSHVLRCAFHHETISLNRRRNNERIFVKQPKLSVLLSGTPAQVQTLIPSTENGLFSRFLFWTLPYRLEWKEVLGRGKPTDCDKDDIDETLQRQVLRMYRCFDEREVPVEFRLTEAQIEVFNACFSAMQYEMAGVYGVEIVSSVRRLALSTFRIAMILSGLRLAERASSLEVVPEKAENGSLLVCEDRDFGMALQVAVAVAQHTAKMYVETQDYASKRDRSEEDLQKPLSVAEAMLLNHLPVCFKTREACEKAEELNISRRNCFRFLKKYVYQQLVREEQHGAYEKMG